MFSRAIAIVLLVGSCSTGYSQDGFPRRMIGFLKVEQHVGIPRRMEPGISLIVFTDKIDMDIHRDAERLAVDELRHKYDKVEQQAIELIRSHNIAENGGTEPTSLSPRLEIGRVSPISYARVLHVGDDYVLLEYDSGYKRAYSSNQIASIAWDDGKPNLHIAGENSAKKPDRTKP